jgi:prolyl oligopeptidase
MRPVLRQVFMMSLLTAFASAAPPVSKTIDHVDEYHGVKVPDPYRWLEDDVRTSKDVADWVTAQNEVTFGFLESIPQRKPIQQRLTELWNFERVSPPAQSGGRYFYSKNDGLQNQSVLYVMESLTAVPRVLIDPNAWSKDGTVALGTVKVSPDGRYAAFGRQEAGSDWSNVRVLEVETGKELADELKWIKFSSPEWTPDGNGFFYSRFPEPEEGQAFQNLNLNQQVYFHRVGTSQADDILVYHRPDHPDWTFHSTVSEDGRYLILTIMVGTDDRYRVYYKDLSQPLGLPLALIDNFDHEYSFLGNDGPVFYFRTTLKAPKKRIIAIDTRKPSPENYREILAEQPEVMENVSLIANQFLVETLKDAKTEVNLYGLNGRKIRHLDLPGIGTASGFAGKRSDSETFYAFSSFNTPASIFRYDLLTGESQLWKAPTTLVKPDDYAVEQVFYKSKDGTRVPMFLAYKKGLKRDGSNPTLLYGYGGFSISLTPTFSVSRLQWMEMGGVFALANLRGGGEYGEDWHKAGTKLQKQNVFDDFIAAAEYLIAEKYTRSDKLAIQGGSNGGLLVGACLTQRPDLFGACLPAVGVMDMLRFQKFTAGRYWVDDFGSSDNADEFPALLEYSPYHNCKPGVKYPPTMITTADTDDRVVPGHSFKFAAALQAAQAGDKPILIRIETRAGHGAGKPTAKIIEETADQWAFLVKTLEFEPVVPAK